jgi:hypothetical protein
VHSIDVISKVYKIKDIAYLQHIMETWEKEKSWFLEEWGGPIKKIKSNFEADLSKDAKHNIKSKCVNKIYKVNEDKKLINLIVEYLHELDEEEFFSNMTHQIHTIRENFVTIGAGVKVAKSIKKFYEQFYGDELNEDNKNTLLKIQMILSNAQQKSRIKGDLYLSVHPLDFLTMSTNNHNWVSCHALNHCYSAGNFAYIQDSCTCVVYLLTPGNEQVQLHKLPEGCLWNDKSWRMLMFLSEDKKFAGSGRHYPFEIQSLEHEAALALVPSCNHWRYHGKEYVRKLTLYDRLCSAEIDNGDEPDYYYFGERDRKFVLGYELHTIGDVIVLNENRPNEEPRFYCDILDSGCYTPHFYHSNKGEEWYSGSYLPRLHIGKNGCGCLICGNDASCQSFGLPFCKDCFLDSDKTDIAEDWWTCCACGFQAHEDETQYMLDSNGNVYCNDCFTEDDDIREDEY